VPPHPSHSVGLTHGSTQKSAMYAYSDLVCTSRSPRKLMVLLVLLVCSWLMGVNKSVVLTKS
jgi:hypothetical protein